MNARVALVKCEDYDQARVDERVNRCLDLLGEAADAVKPGSKVLLKPNLLIGAPPERAINTHPEIVRAVARRVKAAGGTPVAGDNPAITRIAPTLRKAGILSAMEEEGVEIGNFSDTFHLHNPDGKTFKRFEISKAFDDADVIFNLCKFKTHGITYMTGALKNLFGSIPGLEKSKWHLRAQSREEFASFLVDLYGAFLKGFDPPKPIIHLMDAVLTQEGEGPGTGGTPREVGALLAGTDAAAVDATATRLVGMNADMALTCVFAQERGIGVADEPGIEIAGDPPGDFRIENYVTSRSTFASNMMVWPLTTNFARNQLVEKPLIVREKCSGCLSCVKICPADAVAMQKERDEIPRYDYDKCIRCYCCQEVCPEGAIELRRGRLHRLFNLFNPAKDSSR